MQDRHKTPDGWKNYGDVNPKRHGGRFVRWNDDHGMWEVVETKHPDDLPSGRYESGSRTMVTGWVDEWLISRYWVEPMDLFVDGEEENGLTDVFEAILESFGDRYSGILEHEELPPDADIAYFVVDVPWHAGIRSDDYNVENYWEFLENKFGIVEDEL